MEVVVTTGAIRRAKLQSKCDLLVFFAVRRHPSYCPTNRCQSSEGELPHMIP